jgi:hypothetical protein
LRIADFLIRARSALRNYLGSARARERAAEASDRVEDYGKELERAAGASAAPSDELQTKSNPG